MKYVIVGAGPTGLSLAYVLANNGYEVDLIEKDAQLGGSWNAQWAEGKYFSESSPRVLLYPSEFFNFLFDIGMTMDDFGNIYGNFFQTMIKFSGFFMKHFTLNDYLIFTQGVMIHKLSRTEKTFQDWLDTSGLSEGAKKALTIFCITINAEPYNTHINDMFGAVSPIIHVKQMKDPNQWLKIIEHKFSLLPNIKVYKNMEVINLTSKDGKIERIIAKNNRTAKVMAFEGERFVIATEPNAFPNMIKNASSDIKNNWNSYNWLKEWSSKSFYIGFGFQLHFREKIEFPDEWCWSCKDDWNVIITPVSNWLNEKSKDPLINTVWSCCITKMDAKSSKLKLTANQCSREQIIDESIRQIRNSMSTPLLKPYKVTYSDGLYRMNNKWISKNTGFSRQPNLGYLPIQGNIENLFALGCYTNTGINMVAHSGTAIGATMKFLNEYEPRLSGFHNKYHKHRLLIMTVLIFIYYRYLISKKK